MATLFNEYVFLLFIYFKCTSSFFVIFLWKLQSPRLVDYVHILYFNISVAVRSLANRGPMYLLPFFNFLIKMFWFSSVWQVVILAGRIRHSRGCSSSTCRNWSFLQVLLLNKYASEGRQDHLVSIRSTHLFEQMYQIISFNFTSIK